MGKHIFKITKVTRRDRLGLWEGGNRWYSSDGADNTTSYLAVSTEGTCSVWVQNKNLQASLCLLPQPTYLHQAMWLQGLCPHLEEIITLFRTIPCVIPEDVWVSIIVQCALIQACDTKPAARGWCLFHISILYHRTQEYNRYINTYYEFDPAIEVLQECDVFIFTWWRWFVTILIAISHSVESYLR